MNELQNVNQLTTEILFYKNQAAQNFLEIGKRLNQVKAMIPEGEWVKYLQDKVSFSRQTANKLMRCANEFGDDASTRQIPMSKMFELLALPAENRGDFMQKNNVEELAQKKLREQIKKYKKELAEAKEVNDSLRSERNEFKQAATDIQKHLEDTRRNLQTYAEDRIKLKELNKQLEADKQELKNELDDTHYLYDSQGEYTRQLKAEIAQLKQELTKVPEGKETIVIQDNPKTLEKLKELEEKLKQEKIFMGYEAILTHERQILSEILEKHFTKLDFLAKQNKRMAKKQLTMIDEIIQNYQTHINKVEEQLINDRG